MTLEEMKNRTIYVVPQFQEDWKLMLVIEEMSLFDLANIVNRNTTHPHYIMLRNVTVNGLLLKE